MTSRSHACLFTKDHCLPCTKTKDYLREVLAEGDNLGQFISVLKKENHTALVTAYELDTYPTLLLVDSLGNEQARVVGGKKVREILPGMLKTLEAFEK